MRVRLIGVFVSLVMTLLLGFLPGPDLVKKLFHLTGYYFVFILFLIWGILLALQYVPSIASWAKKHFPAMILSIMVSLIIINVSPPQLKVLLDESNLVGTSMSMYMDKTVSVPFQGLDFQDAKHSGNLIVDRRPLVYPFLISVVHSLNGYRFTNGFAVNFVCSVCILFFTYLLSTLFFSRIISLTSILMMACMPGFMIWVTSGGFEAANLTFLLINILLLYAFFRNPEIRNMEILILTVAILMQCRYESILFGIALLFVLPYLKNMKLVSRISLFSLSLPIFFIPVIWQRRLFWGVPEVDVIGNTFLISPATYKAFSFSNAVANLPDNIFVLLGIDPNYGFSPVIVFMTLLGGYLLLKKLLFFHQDISSAKKKILFYGVMSFVMLFAVYSCFYLGKFTYNINNRFAFMFLPFMILPAVYFLSELYKRYNRQAGIIMFICITFLFINNLTYASRQVLVHDMALQKEFYKINALISLRFSSDQQILIINDNPSLYFIKQFGSVSFDYVKAHKEKILNTYSEQFDRIIVIQKFLFLNNSPFCRTRMGDGYELETIGKIPITKVMYIKVSMVKNIRRG